MSHVPVVHKLFPVIGRERDYARVEKRFVKGIQQASDVFVRQVYFRIIAVKNFLNFALGVLSEAFELLIQPCFIDVVAGVIVGIHYMNEEEKPFFLMSLEPQEGLVDSRSCGMFILRELHEPAVELEFRRQEMVVRDRGGVVAFFLKNFRQRVDAIVRKDLSNPPVIRPRKRFEFDAANICSVTVGRWISRSHDREKGRQGPRRTTATVVEDDRRILELADGRRRVSCVSIKREMVGAKGVNPYQDHILFAREPPPDH